MAKKKNAEEKKEKKGGGAIVSVIVVTLIILLWLAIFSIIIKLDIGGLGSTLRPMLKDIPIINSILPNVPLEVEALEKDYPFTNFDQAIQYIRELEAEKASLEEANASYNERIAALEAENARLKVFEDDVLAFEERVKRFDYQVVFNSKAPSISEYDAFYHEINPDTADEIHELIAKMQVYDEGIQKQADYLKTVKPAKAAEILEESPADIGRIVNILQCMKDDEAAAILNKMSTLYAAKILQRMDDMAKENMENSFGELSKYLNIGLTE